MFFYEGFDKTGFLCAGIENNIEKLRAENAEWFSLADDTNAAFMRTAIFSTSTVKTSSMAPEAVAVRILLRSCGMLQGCIILTERGMIAEGRTLARCLFENAFSIAAIHDDPVTFIEILKDDFQASRTKQSKFILDRDMINTDADRDKLNLIITNFKKNKRMNQKQVAELGPLALLYLSYQRLSDDSAHLSARSLHRHVSTNPIKSGWGYKWGPGDMKENAATLYYAIVAAISIGVGITQILKDKEGNSKFSALSDRFQAMPPVATI